MTRKSLLRVSFTTFPAFAPQIFSSFPRSFRHSLHAVLTLSSQLPRALARGLSPTTTRTAKSSAPLLVTGLGLGVRGQRLDHAVHVCGRSLGSFLGVGTAKTTNLLPLSFSDVVLALAYHNIARVEPLPDSVIPLRHSTSTGAAVCASAGRGYLSMQLAFALPPSTATLPARARHCAMRQTHRRYRAPARELGFRAPTRRRDLSSRRPRIRGHPHLILLPHTHCKPLAPVTVRTSAPCRRTAAQAFRFHAQVPREEDRMEEQDDTPRAMVEGGGEWEGGGNSEHCGWTGLDLPPRPPRWLFALRIHRESRSRGLTGRPVKTMARLVSSGIGWARKYWLVLRWYRTGQVLLQ
ncbi:hypothetical protein B0H13DRAFT_1889990 [Mycena leptocephala]|nr:hypothetical protein B0H13DRAFT_1889990 [Mycena leptocephala]